MSFPGDLLDQARHLANRERTRPKQASLRRAVSTAYYALFHLLIAEAALNWKHAEHRNQLSRQFQHVTMKQASTEQAKASAQELNRKDLTPPARYIAMHLKAIATTFVSLQDQRHKADYDNSTKWTRTDVVALVAEVAEAFRCWTVIRKEPAAQKYLLSLLVKPRGP